MSVIKKNYCMLFDIFIYCILGSIKSSFLFFMFIQYTFLPVLLLLTDTCRSCSSIFCMLSPLCSHLCYFGQKRQQKAKGTHKFRRFQESSYMDPNQSLCLGALFNIAATNVNISYRYVHMIILFSFSNIM